jgi:hypothetical protein
LVTAGESRTWKVGLMEANWSQCGDKHSTSASTPFMIARILALVVR